jgi:hypothetical protein
MASATYLLVSCKQLYCSLSACRATLAAQPLTCISLLTLQPVGDMTPPVLERVLGEGVLREVGVLSVPALLAATRSAGVMKPSWSTSSSSNSRSICNGAGYGLMCKYMERAAAAATAAGQQGWWSRHGQRQAPQTHAQSVQGVVARV